MKNKTPLVLGGVFLLLVGIFLLTSINPREKSKGAVPLFEGDKPKIDKIEINNRVNDFEIVVEEKNGVWSVTSPFEYKASKQVVDQSINTLLNVVVDGVISERPEAQDELARADKRCALAALSAPSFSF